MRFENVARLICGLEQVFRDMRYTWIDSHGIICQQQITCRVNCMDCLDRTNVVQVIFFSFLFKNNLKFNLKSNLKSKFNLKSKLKSKFNLKSKLKSKFNLQFNLKSKSN